MAALNASQLAAFAAIIRNGSFESAAKSLHVTSSAISQRLKQLEDSLGQVLVVRDTPCRPTTAGRALLRHAIQVELLEQELFENLGLNGSDGLKPVSVPVAVNADSLDGWFRDAFEETCINARIMLDVRVDDQNHSAYLLRDGEVMAAVSASPTAVQGCSVEYLGSMRYLALSAAAFRDQYFSAGVNVDTLAKAPVLVYNAKDGMQADFIESLTARRMEPPSHFVPSTPAFLDIARRGLGWGMIPEHMAKDFVATGELVEIHPGAHFDIKLYFHRWQLQSSVLDVLSNAVRMAARQLV